MRQRRKNIWKERGDPDQEKDRKRNLNISISEI